ncbi:hypothetical protein RX330_02585 [Bradyrhizobium sp. NDS-1]|uniref:hypothetical protein n=1 Tax=Bradyrhizobium sp. NDS-1 TaxID=3080014 RepID=UPI00293EB346|nr:hypothetical protein [Bradyrhizobium sp. NDS-1]WOH74029.1 hypothetical protein RX330_02585 [Bradyrhizobium sp. NDS-1]
MATPLMFHVDPAPVTLTTATDPAFTPTKENPDGLLVNVLPFWIVRLADPPPELTNIVPLVPVAAPETPRMVGFGAVVLMVTGPFAGTPPVQLAAFVQSVLTLPFQVCAAAEPAERAISAAAETVARRSCRVVVAVAPGARADDMTA